MSLSKPKEEFVVIVDFDVSGSMEQPFNETAKRGTRSDSIFSMLEEIIQNTDKQNNTKIGVNIFGCKLASTCDFIKFISAVEINEPLNPVDIGIINYCESNSSNYKQKLGKLAEKFGARYLILYLNDISEDLIKDIYEIAIKDRNLCIDLVHNLPQKVKSGAATVMVKGSAFIGSHLPFVGSSIGNYYDSSVQSEVNKALDLCCQKVSSRISCSGYNWNTPVDLEVINGTVLKTKLNEFKEKIKKIGKIPFSYWIKQYIYGRTPTSLSLSQSFEVFSKDDTKYRILFLVTDGQYNEGEDPFKNVIDNLSKDELKNVIIVSCFFSSNYIDKPRKLYYKCPSNLDSYCQKLFNISSLVSTNSSGFDILARKYNWELPQERACHLFFQVNHPDIINEFSKVVTDLVNEENYFTNAFSSIYMDVIRNDQLMNQQSFDQNNEPICFAYACSCAIQLSLCRIFCRDIYSFNSIFEQILTDFSPKRDRGAVTSQVLQRHCPRYNLHFKELENEESAKLAITLGRVCVAVFWLPGEAWHKFSRFFRNNPKGILQRSDLLKADGTLGDKNHKDSGSHAVVLIDANISALEFLNSWGPDFGNNGRFRVRNAAVLNITFYDVYWTLNDLTQVEKNSYESSIRATSEAILNNDPDPSKYCALYFRCTHCHKLVRDDNLSTSSNESICPFCNLSFNPRESTLRRGLFEPS